MKYIYIINGRADKASYYQEFFEQLKENPHPHEVYTTLGEGDATRYVRLYCDLHPDEEVCFVACGGSELDGLDFIFTNKILKKFESLNIGFLKQELKELNQMLDKLFGSNTFPMARNFIDRLIASNGITSEQKEKLTAARQMISEVRNVHISKPDRKYEHAQNL